MEHFFTGTGQYVASPELMSAVNVAITLEKPLLIKGELDMACVPANLAATLYQKTEGQIVTLGINTLGVLYVVASDDSITSVADLKGKTVYMTGKGTTPEYVMNYLLKENGLAAGDVDLQFKSEATEVASLLKENPDAIGVLPAFAQNACGVGDCCRSL